MNMCTYPWSNKDLFAYVSDCHIYLPVHYFICSMIIILSFFCILYSLRELNHRIQKELPIASLCIGLLYFMNHLILVIADKTYIDRDLGLNFIHSLGRSMVWISLTLHSFKHLGVIISVDNHTVAKSTHLHQFLMKINYGMFAFNILAEVIIMVLVTMIKELDMINYLACLSIIIIFINIFPRIIYAWQVRQIIVSVRVIQTENFYAPIQKQLEQIVSGTIISSIMGELLLILWLVVPAIRYNLYIAYNLQVVVGTVSGIMSLYQTQQSSQTINENHNLNKGKKHSKRSKKARTSNNSSHGSLKRKNNSTTERLTTTTTNTDYQSQQLSSNTSNNNQNNNNNRDDSSINSQTQGNLALSRSDIHSSEDFGLLTKEEDRSPPASPRSPRRDLNKEEDRTPPASPRSPPATPSKINYDDLDQSSQSAQSGMLPIFNPFSANQPIQVNSVITEEEQEERGES